MVGNLEEVYEKAEQLASELSSDKKKESK